MTRVDFLGILEMGLQSHQNEIKVGLKSHFRKKAKKVEQKAQPFKEKLFSNWKLDFSPVKEKTMLGLKSHFRKAERWSCVPLPKMK